MAKKANKYHNKKVVYDGKVFDSIREKDRYVVLREAERQGKIAKLECQPKFELIPSIKEKYIKHLKTKDKECERVVQLAVNYKADFRYTKGESVVIEDIKVSPKILPKEFVLKVKMMRYFHGIKVRLVYKATEPI